MQRQFMLIAVMGLLAPPSIAHAGPLLFTGTGPGSTGTTLNASALFQITGNVLKVTLRNTGDTSGSGKDLSANTLTGVFFKLPTGITLSPASAQIAPGALLQGNKCDVGPCNGSTTNVGGEFAYRGGAWAPHDGNHGISSSGYIYDGQVNGDGPLGNFGGANLDGPASPNGINFGIVAPVTGGNPFIADAGNMAKNPLIEGEVVFTMAIAGGTLLESQISNVSFQYGTSFTEPKLPGGIRPAPPIPEPATVLLLGPALVFALRRRRANTAR